MRGSGTLVCRAGVSNFLGVGNQSVKARLIAVLIGAASPAAAQQVTGNADAGHELASKLCAACHIVGSERVGSDVAPPFPVIAQDPAISLTALHAWNGPGHPMLPNLALTGQQIADINAYLDMLHGEQAPRVKTEEPPPALEAAPPEKLGEPIKPSGQ
jgi:mono/diheme cytochrome c family protein